MNKQMFYNVIKNFVWRIRDDVKELIVEIKKLNPAEQHRLKEFFINSIASFSASEPVFQEVTERKNKDGYTCTNCRSKQVVRFGKYKVKLGLIEIERQ